MPVELRRTDAYSGSFRALTREQREAVQDAEAEIADDPTHSYLRRPGPHGTTIELTAANKGILIAFRVVSATIAELVELLDLQGVRIE